MEFLALVNWLMLGGIATVIAPFAITTPGVGFVVLGVFTGVAACILFIVLGAPVWLGWAQFALAVIGILGGGLAAAWLNNDQVIAGSVAEEVQAGAVGLALPFLFSCAFVTLLVALQVTDPVV